MFGELRILFAIADFLWKAAQSYAATPEGQKDLADIEAAANVPTDATQTTPSTVEGVAGEVLSSVRAQMRRGG